MTNKFLGKIGGHLERMRAIPTTATPNNLGVVAAEQISHSESSGFDRKRWTDFIKKLETQIAQIHDPEARELLERFKDPEYLLSSAASLKVFAENPRHRRHVDAIHSLVAHASIARQRYDAVGQNQQQIWRQEMLDFAQDGHKDPSPDNPFSDLIPLATAPEQLEAIAGLEEAALPKVTIPDQVVPPGLSQKSWNGIMWTAAGVSTLATAWGFSDTVKGGILMYPETYEALDRAMRSIGTLPITGSQATILTLTAGVGLALSGLVSVGIKRGRDNLARTSFEHSTGTLGAMVKNPASAALFWSMVAISGAGAIKGVVTNFAKSEQTQQFSGTALKEIAPVLDKTQKTYENAETFNKDFDRYLFLLVKEEGESLNEKEGEEKSELVKRGWAFPPVKKQIVGEKAVTKAWAIDNRDILSTAEEKFHTKATALKARIVKDIPKDQLPLRGYATRMVSQIDLASISKRVHEQLNGLKEGLETNAANKYMSAILMFLGLMNADPQTAQDTLNYAKEDLDKIPGEAQKLKDSLGKIGDAYAHILNIIQGGKTNSLKIAYPDLPAAKPETLKEIADAFEKIKSMLPERPASIWIPETDWTSAMQFLGAKDTPESRMAVQGVGIALYGFIDLVLALLYLRSSRRKKEHLDTEVPERFGELEDTENKVAYELLRKFDALRPTIQSALGVAPAPVDLEYLRAMLRKQARDEVTAFAEFTSWEKKFPPGSMEYLMHVNEKKNDLIPQYGAWLQGFAQMTSDTLLPPAHLIEAAYPEYARASEFLAQLMNPKTTRTQLLETYTALRVKALNDGAERETERLAQKIQTILAEEAARRSYDQPVTDRSQSELVRQLYEGTVFPLKEDAPYRIVTLLGQNTALLQLQYVTEQQRSKRHDVERMFASAPPSTKRSFTSWFNKDGRLVVSDAELSEFIRKTENRESPEYALVEKTKASINMQITGGLDYDRQDFDQDRALAQLNYIRTSFAPFAESALSRHPAFANYRGEVCYGIDPSSGRPTALIALYDKRENNARVAIAAYPGRIPNMQGEEPKEIDGMLRDWYELTVENELLMRLHTRELATVSEHMARSEGIRDALDLRTINTEHFPFASLVQYTIDQQRLRLLEERTSLDLLYNPITDREMEMLRFGDMIAIRGYRPFEPEVIKKIFEELAAHAKDVPELDLQYDVHTRKIVVKNKKTGTQNSVPIIYYRDADALLKDVRTPVRTP